MTTPWKQYEIEKLLVLNVAQAPIAAQEWVKNKNKILNFTIENSLESLKSKVEQN